MSRRAALACVAADVAFAAAIIGLLALIAALLVRPDLNLFHDAFSFYAIGPWAAVQIGAFAALGIASLGLSVAFLTAGKPHYWQAPSALFLALSGVCAFALIWFPMGIPSLQTFIGDMHQTVGTIGGVTQLAAVLCLIFAMRGDARWHSLRAPAIVAFALSLVGALLTQIAIWRPDLGIPMGAAMRLVVLPLILLWSAVAWRLRQDCATRA